MAPPEKRHFQTEGPRSTSAPESTPPRHLNACADRYRPSASEATSTPLAPAESSSRMGFARTVALVLVAVAAASAAGVAYNHTQWVDHFSTNTATFQQRYYMSEEHWQGPGRPIFMIMGGEGAIPESVGLYYPFIYDVLAKHFGALVVEPEHRFYGTSQPFGNTADPKSNEHMRVSQTCACVEAE
jgi:hypothetical protein